MRVSGLMVACLCVFAATAYAQPGATPGGAAPAGAAAPAMDQKKASTIASYGVGMNMGRTFKQDGVNIDLKTFIQGIEDGLAGKQPKYTEDELRTAFEVFQRDMQSRQEQRQQVLGDKNKREGQAFLAANKSKAGVKVTRSGLQYQVVQTGKGATPKASDTVKVHYEGSLLDGTVFDSSIKRKEPVNLQVEGVIPGWTEALQMMKVGDKWRLFVPSELAYGADGAGGGAIGPNCVLIFDVELLGIQAPAGQASKPSSKPTAP